MSLFSLCLSFLGGLCLLETNPLSTILLLLIFYVNISTSICFRPHESSLCQGLVFCLLLSTLAFAATSSLLAFFVFYEFSLFPVLGLTFMFGYQPEKVSASLYLLIYTVVGSLPLFLFAVVYQGSVFTGLVTISGFTSLCVSLAFMVNAPVYTLHVWLPKAHVESPIIGSILLSGVMLKLGAYGFILMSPSLGQSSLIWFYLSLLGGVFCSVICYRSWDMNTLVAYSSVVHIGIVTLGCINGTELGVWAGVAMLVSHSLISPLIFLLAYELYLCTSSRSFLYGHVSSLSFSLLIFTSIFCGLNFGLPPSLSFHSEVALFGSIGSATVICLLPLVLSCWLGFLYCISFYIRSMGGGGSSYSFTLGSVYVYLPSCLLSVLLPLCNTSLLIF